MPRKTTKRTSTPSSQISKTAIVPSEHQEQVGLLNWFHLQFPGVLIFAIPNGEKRAITVAKRLKAEGVVRGIPDLFVPEWDLWIEMKRTQGGRLSLEQRDIIRKLENMGHTVIVGLGAAHASGLILEHVKKLLYMVRESG